MRVLRRPGSRRLVRFPQGVTARLTDEQHGRAEPEPDDRDPEEEWRRAKTGRFGDEPGQECHAGDGDVARSLVQAEREPAVPRTDEVDLHQDGGRPRQALVDPEQDIRGDDPRPIRGQDQHERDRNPDEPACNEDGLPPDAIGQRSCDEIRDGLGQAECDQE